MHFEYISQAVFNGIMQVSIESYVPCILGVLTCLNIEQAVERSTGTGNLGLSWGKAAVEMGLARMSALGMGQIQKNGAEVSTSAFVAFNPQPANPGKESDSKQPQRKIGF